MRAATPTSRVGRRSKVSASEKTPRKSAARRTAPGVTVEPRFRINAGRHFAFGPGKAELLEHIERTGSLAEAARVMEMSYMQAWKLVRSLDEAFAEPLVVSVRGGNSRGGAALSATGREVLALYRTLETTARTGADAAQRGIERLLAR